MDEYTRTSDSKSKKFKKKMNYADKPQKIFEAPRLYSYAIWLLSRKDYSVHEISQKMKKYQPDESIIELTVKKLVDSGYINDERRATNLASYYSKKESSYKVKQRLSQKGIDKDTIEKTLQELGTKDNEREIAYKLVSKKFKTFDPEIKQKYYAFLAGKWYGWDVISKAVEDFKENHFENNSNDNEN